MQLVFGLFEYRMCETSVRKMKKANSNQALNLRDAVFLIASIVGIIVDLTFLLEKSNGIISVLILLVILVYYFRPRFISRLKKIWRPNKKCSDGKHKLIFVTPDGKRRTDLIVETPIGRRSTSNGGCVMVDPNAHEFSENEYEIWIFSKDGKFIKSEMIVRTNNEPVVMVVVQSDDLVLFQR